MSKEVDIFNSMMNDIAGANGTDQPKVAEQEQEVAVKENAEEVDEAPEPAIEEPVQEEKTEDSSTPTEVESEKEIVDWLEDDKGDVSDEPYKALAKELGFEVDSKDALLSKIKSQALEDLPDELKGAIELAKKDGDYKEYLGLASQDFSDVDPETFYISSIEKYFKDESGQVDQEALRDYVESQDDIQIKMQGEKIKKQYLLEQKQKIEDKKQSYIKAQEQKNQEINQAVSSINSVAGFKLNQASKNAIEKDLRSGNAHVVTVGGKTDWKKTAEFHAMGKYAEKMIGYIRSSARNEGAASVIKESSNVTVGTGKGRAPSPDNKKVDNPINDYIKQMGVAFRK